MIFTEEDKIKIWLDYMTTIVQLNNNPLELPYKKEHELVDRFICYPIFGITTVVIENKHRLKSFEIFCSETNELESSNVYGWYWRFKDRIFKNK